MDGVEESASVPSFVVLLVLFVGIAAGATVANMNGGSWSTGGAIGLVLTLGLLIGALFAAVIPTTFSILLILVWIGSIIASVWIAGDKGRSRWLGAALGLGLNLIGVLAAFLLPPAHDAPSDQRLPPP